MTPPIPLTRGDALSEQSTQSAKRRKADNGKPKKPRKDFPLFPHASGRWAKKIRGKPHYFGRWGTKQGPVVVPVDDVKASAASAEELYKEQSADLCAGREPKPKREDGCTLVELCNTFLTSKKNKLDNGELSPHTFTDYERTCGRLLKHFGTHAPPLLREAAGESKDQVAVNAIMGRVDNSMAAMYRERISDERFKAVTDHVHDWLFEEDKLIFSHPPGTSLPGPNR